MRLFVPWLWQLGLNNIDKDYYVIGQVLFIWGKPKCSNIIVRVVICLILYYIMLNTRGMCLNIYYEQYSTYGRLLSMFLHMLYLECLNIMSLFPISGVKYIQDYSYLLLHIYNKCMCNLLVIVLEHPCFLEFKQFICV